MTTYNKVTINNQTLIDLSSDTVTPNTLLNGVTAHDNSGAIITGTYVPSGGATINNQNKTVRPSEQEQSIIADNGYTGLGTVTIEAIDDEYIGSAINRRDETDLTSTNNVVTVPAGYYAEEETKTIATVSHTAPTISINTSTGVITATHIQGGGYVSEDTQTATENLSIQAAATIIPGSSAQTAVTANKYTTGAITVAAVPTETKSITANGTYAPTTGKYFSSVTVNVPTVNISQDANGYIVLDDESGYGGGGGSDLVDWLSNATTTLERSDVITIGDFAARSHRITKVNLPNCIAVGVSGLKDIDILTSVSLPNCVTLGVEALRNCRLPGIVLPKCTSIGTDCFYQNGNGFTYADIGNAADNSTLTLGVWAFELLANFNLLIIRYPVRAVMANANALIGTCFKSGGAGGDIYIPKSLYDHLGDGTADDYKAATNWSTYDGYGTITWHAIEGSQYENYYADGTPIE